jgi:iron complex outermembrane receptor protein
MNHSDFDMGHSSMGRTRLVFRAMLPLAGTLGFEEPAEGQTDSTRRDSVVVLPSVNVTVQRRSPSPYAVPLATTSLSPRSWAGGRGIGLDQALNLVPGVLAQSRYGTGDIRLVIRGFGARGAGDRSNAGTSRGVRVLLDGFPETEPDGRTSFDGIDLGAAHGIDVIRSNASSLWGNAAGGVVSLSTMPEFERRFAEGEVAAGGFGFQRYLVRFGLPMRSGRLATTLTRTVFDGWRANSAASRWLGNAALTASLGPTTDLGVFVFAAENQFEIPGPLTADQVTRDPEQANPTYLSRRERRHNRVGRLGTSVQHDFGAGGTVSSMLYVNPKFLQRSERGTFRDFTRYHVGGNVVYSNSARLSDKVRGRLLTGVDEAYQDGAILFYSLTPEGTRGPELRDNKREGANNLGVFAQGELELNSRLGLSFGARYDAITYYSESFIDQNLSDAKAFTRVTPKIGLNYRLSPLHSVYLNVGGGVEAPAGNETDPASTFGQDTVFAINPLLEPIRSVTYEVGSKQLVVFGREHGITDLSYDVALYRTSVTNEIVPYRGGRFYFTAGKARRTGAELGMSVNTRPGVSVQGSFTWSDNKYVEYLVDSVHYDRAKQGRFADFSGNRIVGIPSVMYGLSLGFAPEAWRGVRAQATLQGIGNYFADDANTIRVDGYAVVNGVVTLDRPVSLGGGSTIRGSISVNNLFNRKYLGSAFLNPDVVGGVPVAFEPGLPRSVVMSVALGWR